MSFADLQLMVLEVGRAKTKALVHQAWRTAVYGRVKNIPALAEELAEVDEAYLRTSDGGGVDEAGRMSRERMEGIWARIQGYFLASNANFEARA